MTQVGQTQDTNATSVALAAHLFLTHFLAAGAGLLTWRWLAAAEAAPRLAVSLGMAGLAGLILTINIQRTVRVLDWALAHLSETIPIKELSRRGHGPLAGVVTRLYGLVERERPFTELRAQQLKQTGEVAAQEERNRLARDLHDSIKQQLFSIHVGTAAVQARWKNDPNGAKTALKDVRHSAQAALAEMNALLHQLSPEPLAKVGLVEALRQQCEALGYRTGADVQTVIGPLPNDERFPDGAQEAIFRIAQEALSNVARHARAQTVRLRLEQENDALLLEIEDDGQGFDASQVTVTSGMGLSNLRQRVEDVGGQLTIHSQPDDGTAIRVSIPLQESLQMKETHMNKPDHLFNQVALVGIGGGVALMLALFYPLIIVLPGRFLPEWPQGSPFWGWFLAAVALDLIVWIGYFAARRAQTTTRRSGQLAGALAGASAVVILFMGMSGAAATLMGNRALFRHGLVPAASEDVFLWLITEVVIDTIWWTMSGFVALTLIGAALGAIGGRYSVPSSVGKPGRDWAQMWASGAVLAFVALSSALLSLIVTVAVYALLGTQVMKSAAEVAAVGFTVSLPPVGTAVLPQAIAFLVYIAAQIALFLILRRIEKDESLPQLSSIVVAYLSAFAAVLLPFLMFAGFLVPRETAATTVTTVVVGCLVNLGMGLLLLKTAVSLENRYPPHKKRPGWTNRLIMGLFLSFLVAGGLALTHVARLGLLLLGVATAVYIFTPRHDFSAAQAARANPLPRIFELMLAAMLALLLPALVTVPTALGLTMIPVQAMNVLANADAAYEGTLFGMVQGLYLTNLTALLALTTVPALLMLLTLLATKIAGTIAASRNR
ncbi:MAG: sensor histidine kinase [Chloroflexi bacterium]|nr:sensor histidine kinase [Chloroflexota bacterium]